MERRTEGFLIDTSAIGRMLHPTVRDAWRDAISQGRIEICEVTQLEMLYSARSRAEYEQMKAGFEAMYLWCVTPTKVARRALEIQGMLMDKGAVRGASVADLLVAATAAENNLTVLHYDRDFETIGKLTGLPTRWLAEPGSIP